MVDSLTCVNCGETEGVELESSRTSYAWDGTGKDPNADIPYCRPCAEQHHEFWDAMWAEYYGSMG